MKEIQSIISSHLALENGMSDLSFLNGIRINSWYEVYVNLLSRRYGKQIIAILLLPVIVLFSLNAFSDSPLLDTDTTNTSKGSSNASIINLPQGLLAHVQSIDLNNKNYQPKNINTWNQQAKLLANDGIGGVQFGGSVAVNGDTALIGVRWDDSRGTDSGSAYVFVRNPVTGVWTQQAKLLVSDSRSGMQFGGSVAVSGDIALIGAPADSILGYNEGSAYVFVRNPLTGIWTQQVKLLASDGAAGDRFGEAVDISGDTAVLGARYNDDRGQSSGSAYVFTRNPLTDIWTQQTKLLASDGAAVDYFGWSVAVSGATIVVGAYNDDDQALNAGSAYVFVRNPINGAWAEQAKLLASDGIGAERFGWSVSVNGDTTIIGAHNDPNLWADPGSAYVFVRNPTSGTWSEQAKLLASDGAAYDFFGFTVGVSGDTALVGAYADDDLGANSGSVYVFVRNPTTGAWTEQTKLQADDGTASDLFGSSVALNGDTALIGAYSHGDLGFDSGSAYVFKTRPALLKDDIVIDFGSIGLWARMNDSSWQKLNNSSPDDVITGDVDGNGVDDIIADFGSTFGGLFIKRNGGAWSKLHNSSPQSMATGDLDGNGKDDIIIDFGSIGLWARMNDTSWTKLNNSSPDQFVITDMDGNGADDVIADFGSTFGGLFVKRNLGGWSKMHNTSPVTMATGDIDGNGSGDVIINFGGIGLWARMNNASWTKLHNGSPDSIVSGDVDGNGADDVIATFGSTTSGVWQKLNLGGWSKLNNNAPDQMVMGDVDANGQSDLIAAFNSTLGGIFVRRNNGGWAKLHNSNPDDLAIGGLDGF